MEEKNVKKRRLWKWVLLILILMALAVIVFYYFWKRSTYDYAQVVKTYENTSTSNGNYMPYADGVLEYSRDGIAMLTKEGEEIWNQPCQMSNPIAEVCNDTAAIGDKGGTSIYVFQKSGLKGEIQTTRPIEKIAVSSQGIVAAILQDEENPQVICYDAKGNSLVEHKASFDGTGYPVNVSISHDGNVLLVSYLSIDGAGVTAKATYYHFGQAGQDKEDHIVAHAEFENTVIPTMAFLSKKVSVMVSDHSLIYYQGLDEPKEMETIELDKKIRSVACQDGWVALVLKNAESSGYELRVYDAGADQVMTAEFEGEYANIKIAEKQIFLYDGSKCMIFNDAGVCKYEGNLEMNIMDIFPILGLNKYMVISANGFQEIQLAK